MIGSQTRCAIAAMSRLAEVYDGGSTRLSATDIADSRSLQRPYVSKILSFLSQAGLVTGSRGPGGGFTLARPPEEIAIYDVFRLFEREGDVALCPFGGGICGDDNPCPLHFKMKTVNEATAALIHGTTFAEFTPAAREAAQSQRIAADKRRDSKKKPPARRPRATTKKAAKKMGKKVAKKTGKKTSRRSRINKKK